MRRSRIPAIFLHSTAGNCNRVSSGTFFVASPMTSTLRTKARLSTSFCRNASHVVWPAWAERNSASRRMSRSNSTVAGSIAHGGQDQPRLSLTERFIGHQIHAPAQQFLEHLVERKKIVVGALGVLELDIDVHIAVVARVATGKRTE